MSQMNQIGDGQMELLIALVVLALGLPTVIVAAALLR
jgi:hypothetical protein